MSLLILYFYNVFKQNKEIQNPVTAQRKCYIRQFKATLQGGARKGTKCQKTLTFSEKAIIEKI